MNLMKLSASGMKVSVGSADLSLDNLPNVA